MARRTEWAQEPEPYYTIRVDDVDKEHVRIFGRAWRTADWIGRILLKDVGKRVYVRSRDNPASPYFITSAILQVENDEQRAARETA